VFEFNNMHTKVDVFNLFVLSQYNRKISGECIRNRVSRHDHKNLLQKINVKDLESLVVCFFETRSCHIA
jgi:hypothetical protein